MSTRCDDSCRPKALGHTSKRYRRALVAVVVLNLGTGVAEAVAGWLGLSQALKADALDFLGDGAITLLALIAISRGPRWRARAAHLQGLFLGCLALGVVVAAVYRAFEPRLPEAATMATMGIVGLIVNVAAALILVLHRRGDANVRAVWLFSRNDALANVAVILAGALVSWTQTGWPDIAVAAIIAGLFIASSLEILRHSRRELRSLADTPHPEPARRDDG